MRKIVMITLIAMGLAACGNRQNRDTKTSPPNIQKEYVEVLYFHGKQRCVTCNAIEKRTKEVVEGDFSEYLKNGKVVFKVIDISTNEGEKIADNYEVTWSSLWINRWNDGKEERNDMTDFAFSCAKNSADEFKSGVKKKIEELLK